MNKIDIMNRQTREHNARNVNRFNPSTPSNWRQNYCNNQTFYQNNGQYSSKY